MSTNTLRLRSACFFSSVSLALNAARAACSSAIAPDLLDYIADLCVLLIALPELVAIAFTGSLYMAVFLQLTLLPSDGLAAGETFHNC